MIGSLPSIVKNGIKILQHVQYLGPAWDPGSGIHPYVEMESVICQQWEMGLMEKLRRLVI